MAARKWTDEQRTEALRIGVHHGWSEAARQLGIPRATVNSWARRAGVLTNVIVERSAAVETASLGREQRRLELADKAEVEALHLLVRMRQATTYPHVKTVGTGEGCSATEVVNVVLDEPSAADVRSLAQAYGILVDKVQLLTGQATDRVDLTGEYDLEAELRAYQQGLQDRGQVKP